MNGGLIHQSQAIAEIRATTNITVKHSQHYSLEDIFVSTAEHQVLMRVLEWLRSTEHGELKLILYLDTHKKNGIGVKQLDIIPSVKERVELDRVAV